MQQRTNHWKTAVQGVVVIAVLIVLVQLSSPPSLVQRVTIVNATSESLTVTLSGAVAADRSPQLDPGGSDTVTFWRSDQGGDVVVSVTSTTVREYRIPPDQLHGSGFSLIIQSDQVTRDPPRKHANG